LLQSFSFRCSKQKHPLFFRQQLPAAGFNLSLFHLILAWIINFILFAPVSDAVADDLKKNLIKPQSHWFNYPVPSVAK